MELKAWAGHLHFIDYLLTLEQALKFPTCGPLYVLFFHSRVSPTPVGVPVEILWNGQTSPHLLSPPWSLDGMRHPSSRSIQHMAPIDGYVKAGYSPVLAGTTTWLWTPARPPYQLLRLCLVSVGWLLGGIRDVRFGSWRGGVWCQAGYLFATASLKDNSTNIY